MSDPKDPQNQKILNYIMAKHAPLVHKELKVLRSKGKIADHINDEDLHFAGFHGLLEAFHRFDHEAAERTAKNPDDNHFAKYASTRIRGKILDAAVQDDPVGRALRTKAKNLADPKS
jgi:DNA-directed RNA polymerase specialized sigma subunit